MHASFETLRAYVRTTKTACHRSSPDGKLQISIPSYGNIQRVDLEMHLEGGLAEASFQPVGYSRLNSYCKGESFQPPHNDQSRITDLNYGNSLTNKAVWGTTEITRAVVTYQLSAKVSKSTAYVTVKGNKLVVPNLLTIDRTSPRGSTN